MWGLKKQILILSTELFFFRGSSASKLSLGAQKSAPKISLENDRVDSSERKF